MPILYKYVISSVLRYFFLVQIIVLSIYLSVDFVEKIDNFINVGIPIKIVGIFFLYKIPFIFVKITPIGFLLATIVFFGFMSRNNEFMVLRSCGVSFRILLKASFILGVIGSLIVIVISELTVPAISVRANKIWLNNVKKRNVETSRNSDIWFKTGNQIVHIKYYFPDKNSMVGISINYLNNSFELVRRIDAKAGSLLEGECLLYDAIEQKINEDTKTHDVALHDVLGVEINLDIRDFEKIGKIADEMNLIELYKYARKVESEGYDAIRYWVDYYGKIAFYVVCIVFNMLAASIVFSNKSDKSTSFNVVLGIGLTFTYWVLHNFFISLGYAGLLPPVVSAWLANLIFLCSVVVMLFNVE